MVEERRKVDGNLSFKGGDFIVVGIQGPPGQKEEPQSLLYPTETSSILIATDSSAFAGLDLHCKGSAELLRLAVIV